MKLVELHGLLKINYRPALGLKNRMVELYSDKKQIIVKLHPYKKKGFKKSI